MINMFLVRREKQVMNNIEIESPAYPFIVYENEIESFLAGVSNRIRVITGWSVPNRRLREECKKEDPDRLKN